MSKSQIIVVIFSSLLFIGLYWGVETKPEKQNRIEKQRVLQQESASINVLLKKAKSAIAKADATSISSLEKELEVTEETHKGAVLKRLSGEWFRLSFPEIAGFYAQKVAEIEKTDTAWSIVSTTFAAGIRANDKADNVRQYCLENAVIALENAITINPENVEHRVNLALCYVEMPPKENPMKGVMMLLDLNKKTPQNVTVLFQLGRLALKTGQYEKAVQRLEQVLEVDIEHRKANCLLASIYENQQQTDKALAFKKRCSQ